jgi:hypothetical protein
MVTCYHDIRNAFLSVYHSHFFCSLDCVGYVCHAGTIYHIQIVQLFRNHRHHNIDPGDFITAKAKNITLNLPNRTIRCILSTLKPQWTVSNKSNFTYYNINDKPTWLFLYDPLWRKNEKKKLRINIQSHRHHSSSCIIIIIINQSMYVFHNQQNTAQQTTTTSRFRTRYIWRILLTHWLKEKSKPKNFIFNFCICFVGLSRRDAVE